MSNKNRGRVFECDSRDVETMSEEERDAYFLEYTNMTYDEFNDYYKDDTPESLEREFREFVKR
jgi:hypothetical protein